MKRADPMTPARRDGPRAVCAVVVVLLLGGALRAEERLVAFPGPWPKGTRFELTRVKEREDYRGDKKVKSIRSTSRIRVELVEPTLVRWTTVDIDVPEAAAANPLVRRMLENGKDNPLELRTDEYGLVQDLANEKEVRRRAAEGMDALRELLAKSGMAKAEIERVTKPEAVTVPMLIKEPRLFTLPVGGQFFLGKEQPYEDRLPFPLTGEMIPTRSSFLLESVDEEAGTAVLVWRQRLDPEKATEAIRRWAKSLGKDEPPETTTFDVEEEARYVVALATGIPRSMKHTHTTTANEQRRVQTLTFTVAPPESR